MEYYYNKFIIILLICSIVFSLSSAQIIENFDDGLVDLTSYGDEDIQPDSWSLDSQNTFDNSPYSLKISGNSWKAESIEPIIIQAGDVWQVASYSQSDSEIQGFGLSDSLHTMFYSFAGTQELNIEEWITVYQGNFPKDNWNVFQLPIADDWFAWFEYLPEITEIVFVNDDDGASSGIVYFDEIIDVTSSQPIPPQVEISVSIGEVYRNSRGLRNVNVQFFSQVEDPDSEEHIYFWSFGDDSYSSEENPNHTFFVEDDHPYTVLLEVVDDAEKSGQATVQIEVDAGETSFPITINFVGDIMLGRGYEYAGGIIPTQGVEAIFEPTLSVLGENADITVANLECPLTTSTNHHPTKPIYFKGSPENVAGLTYAGIDIVTLANNHILDYMLDGIRETQTVLTENNILFSGAGVNSYEAYLPVFYQHSGVNIAFLANSDRTGQYNNYQPYLNAGYNKPGFAYLTPYYTEQQIQSVQDVADLIVIEMHAGSEYSTAPGSDYDKSDWIEEILEDEEYSPLNDVPQMWDVELRHHTIDAGADLVIIHHPHIIQGVEVYNGKLIAHSLGNFAFDLSYAETFPSMILNAKINETGFYDYSITPIYIDDYIPKQATGELGQHLLDYLAMRSKDLDTYLFIDRENVIANVLMDTLLMPKTTVYNRAIMHFEESGISAPIFLPKNGNISSIEEIVEITNADFRLGRELVWMGNFEDEGSSLWNANSDDEWLDGTESFEGQRSLHHRRDSDSPDNIVTNFEKRVKVDAVKKHSLYGFIKTQNCADVTIEIRYYDSRTNPTYLAQEDIGTHINSDTDWTFYYNGLTIPEDTRFVDIRLNSNIPQSGEAHSWFDNVGIIEWTDWTPLTFQSEIINPNDFYFVQLQSDEIVETTEMIFVETIYNQLSVPSPHFSANQILGIAPLEVLFTDESIGVVGYHYWEFGDGAESILQNPNHIYTELGSYSVSLTILDYNGNPVTHTKENYINILGDAPTGDIDANGEIDIYDLVSVINYILSISEPNPYELWTSDLNEDGQINIVDVMMLVSSISEN
ncbi:MAG: CapA family protein [Candidatus Marinimicrobia bacterium]|nr:CapA family protein [Candidatus Neomarinimicrobiota bacterium]MBL7023755.1 CapA family protein [Candidatus Neomarinimicrobiota bacterium]MBL7108952.1 CapA family protein [Candidatus Neomarinimicrobiota bacterium]